MTLKQFSKNIKNCSQKGMDQICEEILREMTLRFLTKVIGLTPVGKSKKNYVGGTLRRGWIVERQGSLSRLFKMKYKIGTKEPTASEIESFVKSLKFKKRGGYYTITVTNPVEYAKFVNYGHRTRGGKSFVQGYHFLENAERYINRNKNKIFNALYERELKRRLGL